MYRVARHRHRATEASARKLIGGIKQALAPEKQSAQVTASGGSRGVGPDRAAKGGSNPQPVKVTVGSNELTQFKNGIV